MEKTPFSTSSASAAMDYNDAIELMFFAYRDFIADPDKLLRAHGAGRAHHRVLHFVAAHPSLSIAALLDILGITKQSLARVLRDLIDAGYIEQRIGANDRRKRLLHLTDKGRRLHDALLRPQTERFAHLLEEVGEEAYTQWKYVMATLINAPNRDFVSRLIETSKLRDTHG